MHRFGVISWLFVALVALTQVACGDEPASQDSCTGGSNMSNPRLVNGLEPAAGGSLLRITWEQGTDQGAQLSSDYFAAARVSSDTTTAVQGLISDVSLTEERQLTVRFRNLGPYLVEHDTLEFALAFPDRRDFISCSHPGMDDEYLLRVRLEFDEQKQLAGSSLTEEVSLGDI
jgi:hypothetical protein